MLINVGAEFGTHLESSDIAVELVEILNKIPEEEFILDFKDVMFITMNYAQAYSMPNMNLPKRFQKSIFPMKSAL